MVFSSLQFVFIFMPVFFICYYLTRNRYRNIVLLLGSLCFYAIGTIDTPFYFVLFILNMLLDYVMALGIERFQGAKKCFLFCDVLLHLICLGLFNYANVFLILPIGISFYSFQGISYVADVYKGKIKAEKELLHFTVYISMFPQLIAGPIVTYGNVVKKIKRRKCVKRRILNGIGMFVFGLGLKVLLANPLGKLWNQTNAIGFESISTPLAWLALAAFSMQIYFDFFGYSLMAIGLGKMLGFQFPINFSNPYTSVTMTQFWRKWHITLGKWFRNYVYIPLGGNRKGAVVTFFNLLIVWSLTGIWHGSGVNFLLWGLLLFLIIFLEKVWIGKFLNKHRFIGHLYMLLLIPLTWAVFAVEDIKQLQALFMRLFPFFGQGVWSVFRYDYLKYWKLYYPFLLIGILFCTKIPYQLLAETKRKFFIKILLAGIFIACAYCMYRGFDDPFLYFRF